MGAYLISILHGAWLTLELAVASTVVAVLLGLVAATAKLSSRALPRTLAGVYSTVIRGIPDLVLMLLIFYGGQIGLNAALTAVGYTDYVEIDPFWAGVLTLGFIYGAYMCETFRGGILAIPRGQIEAGMAYGLSAWQVFVRITFPQLVRLALASFTNNWLVLLKSTALVSLLGLQDMTLLAKQAAAAARDQIPAAPMLFFLFTALIYLVITSVSLLGLRVLERRYDLGVKRSHFDGV
ncbi:ABC transporter permease [Amphibiibacter pelophylacis]|uniref:ABC transporter permease subunit n=1 Tax=Amphibiibacter pelophylacis TaxID=1799477 RepID=A0ACC6P062_9BURK